MIIVLFFWALITAVSARKECETCQFNLFGDDRTVLNPLQFIKEEFEPVLHDTLKEALKSSQIPVELQAKLADSATETIFLQFAPINSKSQINDWNELYFYLPHLKRDIAIWRAQFVSAVQGDQKTFKECSNPAALAKMLVPTFDELKSRKKQ
jgi:hypothetical protein